MATLSYRFDNQPRARVPAQARRIAVFGASGATGAYAVQHALAAGFHVTAFVRDPRGLPLVHPALRVIEGDVLQPSHLLGVLDGHEAVLLALGSAREGRTPAPSRRTAPPVCAQGTANVLAEMRTARVPRLVVLSAASVGESRRTGRFGLGHVMHTLRRELLADKERQEALVRASGTRWTIVRAARFNTHPACGRIALGEDLRWGLATVSRDDVADVMVRLIDDRRSVGKALTAT